ncbi:sensor domain-containing diguanylate cyclase, partial [bacterium AH-315-G05]|nr:sensor domain-containing diguanylate cyclase [bacterium AH-315-G05]
MKKNTLFTSTNPLKTPIIFFIISTSFILSMMQLSKRLYIYLSIDNFAIYSIVLTTLFTSIILFFLISKTITAFSVKNKAILEKNLELEATYSQLLATEDTLHQTIDDLLTKEEALLKSETKYKLILEGSNDAIWEWDIVNNIMYLDKSWELLGFSLDDCESSLESWRNLVHPEDLSRLINNSNDYLNRKTQLYHVKYRMKTKNGDYIWILNRGQATWDEQGNPLRIAGTHTNINDEVKNLEKINQLAYIDTLTGLPNKNRFCEFLHDALAKEKNSNSNFSLLLIDLDGFKLINDSLGHSIGDMILQNISALIASAIADIEDCFMARFGGDEFIIFIPNNHNKDSVFNIAKRILNKFSTTISVSGYDFHITASIGIANYPEHGTTSEIL